MASQEWGRSLARRLHETPHVETLEQLEAALHEKDRKSAAGIGPRRLAMLRAALNQMLTRIRPIRLGPADEPRSMSCLMSIANTMQK
jgi:hypothetical protein